MKMRNNPLKAFVKKSPMKDRRTKNGMEIWHDHKESGKTYGEKGHMGVYDKTKSPGPGYGEPGGNYKVGYKKPKK